MGRDTGGGVGRGRFLPPASARLMCRQTRSFAQFSSALPRASLGSFLPQPPGSSALGGALRVPPRRRQCLSSSSDPRGCTSQAAALGQKPLHTNPLPGHVPSLAPHQSSGGTLSPKRYPTPTWLWECPSSKTLVTAKWGLPSVCASRVVGEHCLKMSLFTRLALPGLQLLALADRWSSWPSPGQAPPQRGLLSTPPLSSTHASRGLSALVGGLRSIGTKRACQKARVLWGLQASCHMVSQFVP